VQSYQIPAKEMWGDNKLQLVTILGKKHQLDGSTNVASGHHEHK
jgi:hypothetical protein